MKYPISEFYKEEKSYDDEFVVREAIMRTIRDILDMSGIDDETTRQMYVLHYFLDNWIEVRRDLKDKINK